MSNSTRKDFSWMRKKSEMKFILTQSLTDEELAFPLPRRIYKQIMLGCYWCWWWWWCNEPFLLLLLFSLFSCFYYANFESSLVSISGHNLNEKKSPRKLKQKKERFSIRKNEMLNPKSQYTTQNTANKNIEQ